MAYLLHTSDRSQKILIAQETSVNLGLDAWAVEFSIDIVGYPTGTNVLYASDFQDFYNGIFISNLGRLEFRQAGTARIVTPNGFIPTPADTGQVVIRVEHDLNGDLRYYKNGVLSLTGSYTVNHVMRCKNFFAWGNQATRNDAISCNLDYFKIEGWSINETWRAGLSNGEGNTFFSESGTLDGTLVNFPSDNSPWLWNIDSPLSTGESRVGTGWAPSIRDFDFFRDFMASKGLTGIRETALARGLLSTNNWNTWPANSFPQGLTLKGVIPYDGKNLAEIAKFKGAHLAFTQPADVPDFVIEDVGFIDERTTSGWILRLEAGRVSRCYLERRGHASPPIYVNDRNSPPRTTLENLVIIPNNPSVLAISMHAYSGQSNIRNILLPEGGIIQATRGFVDNSFIAGTGYVYMYSQSESSRQTNNATQLVDPPTANAMIPAYSGYTSDEFVDFANGDYRIKASSPLHALGIGAFFEDTGVTQPSTAYSFKVYSGGVFVPAIAKVRQSNDWTVATPRG